jgi:hypothetical protein
MFRTVRLLFGLLKLACILVTLYIFFLVNIVGGVGPIILVIALFFVVKFIVGTKKVG